MLELTVQAGFVVATRTREHGPSETYDCHLDICQSAVCPCRDVTVRLTPADDAARAAWPGLEDVCAVVDPFDRCAVEDKASDSTVNFATSRFIADELTEDDWDLILGQFMEIKAQAIDTFVPTPGELEFVTDSIENSASLTGFADIFPFSRPIHEIIDGKSHFIDDQYCLRRHCDCARVVLSLVDTEKTPKGLATWDMAVDLRTRVWRDADTDRPLVGKAASAQITLINQRPDLLQMLAKRRAMLRDTYRISLPSDAPVQLPVRSAPKPGRNEPCPCGSGKKFKRCCAP